MTIIAPITSQHTEKVFPIEVLITKENAEIEKTSKVLLNQIRAVDKERLIKRIGRLDEETVEKVNEALKVSLGLI